MLNNIHTHTDMDDSLIIFRCSTIFFFLLLSNCPRCADTIRCIVSLPPLLNLDSSIQDQVNTARLSYVSLANHPTIECEQDHRYCVVVLVPAIEEPSFDEDDYYAALERLEKIDNGETFTEFKATYLRGCGGGFESIYRPQQIRNDSVQARAKELCNRMGYVINENHKSVTIAHQKLEMLNSIQGEPCVVQYCNSSDGCNHELISRESTTGSRFDVISYNFGEFNAEEAYLDVRYFDEVEERTSHQKLASSATTGQKRRGDVLTTAAIVISVFAACFFKEHYLKFGLVWD